MIDENKKHNPDLRSVEDLTNEEKLLLDYFEENLEKPWDDKMYQIENHFTKNPFQYFFWWLHLVKEKLNM